LHLRQHVFRRNLDVFGLDTGQSRDFGGFLGKDGLEVRGCNRFARVLLIRLCKHDRITGDREYGGVRVRDESHVHRRKRGAG
jgi:hypothetical protein